jgi:ABC-type Fe3+ transport system substrate-binding protein
MKLSRRAVGLGLLGASALVTGAVVIGRSNPGLLGAVGMRPQRALRGFIGGEKQAFLTNPKLVDFLRGEGLTVDSIVAGSVEQCRDTALLSQNPNFLWPASEVLVDLARRSKAPVRRDAIILRSPIVFYSWEPVASGLVKTGNAVVEKGITYADTDKLIAAIVAGKTWADLGVPQLSGRARIKSTDPNRSSSGMHFAGMVANARAGDVATAGTLASHKSEIVSLFQHMGYKTHSSAKLFEDYLTGGMGGSPIAVGYENQLVEWILEDPARWQNVAKNAPHRPVTIYPRPTAVSTHAFISLAADADDLLEALAKPEAQTIAWRDHGFRSSLGTPGAETNPLVAGRMPADLSAILPLPEADVLLALLDNLRTQTP